MNAIGYRWNIAHPVRQQDGFIESIFLEIETGELLEEHHNLTQSDRSTNYGHKDKKFKMLYVKFNYTQSVIIPLCPYC